MRDAREARRSVPINSFQQAKRIVKVLIGFTLLALGIVMIVTPGPGWLTIMLDTTAWSPQQHQAASRAIALYKNKLRPLIRDARLYHVTQRPDGVNWDGMQYWDPSRKIGVLFAFRGSIANAESRRFVLKGLDPARNYALHFEDGTSPDTQATGKQLMSAGAEVHLAHPLSSELVFIQESTGAPHERSNR